jgi:hypothetical protein
MVAATFALPLLIFYRLLFKDILIKCTKNDITQFDIATQSIFKTILEEFTKFPPVLSVLGPYTASNASVP